MPARDRPYSQSKQSFGSHLANDSISHQPLHITHTSFCPGTSDSEKKSNIPGQYALGVLQALIKGEFLSFSLRRRLSAQRDGRLRACRQAESRRREIPGMQKDNVRAGECVFVCMSAGEARRAGVCYQPSPPPFPPHMLLSFITQNVTNN